MTAMPGGRAVPATALLLRAYSEPTTAERLRPLEWSALLGAARRSRTLGHLRLRLQEAGMLASLPAVVAAHFESAHRLISQRRRLLRWELLELAEALQDLPCELVLLKGAAYELQSMPLAGARFASDIDLLVLREHLPAVERRLLGQGWRSAEVSDYDERYYREWSHELPPFTHPLRQVEVDVHHTITPSLSGHSVSMRLLLQECRPIEWRVGYSGRIETCFKSLGLADQLIHAAVHTFSGSDLSLRLREVMDFDFLYRGYMGDEGSGALDLLFERADQLGQSHSLWWALSFSRRWLGTPVPDSQRLEPDRPPFPQFMLMNWCADRAMLPGVRQRRTGSEVAAETALLMRHHWQRMPIYRLVPHLVRKAYARLARGTADT